MGRKIALLLLIAVFIAALPIFSLAAADDGASADKVDISELIKNEEEYEKFLIDNREFFIEKCGELALLEDYLSIKQMCEELSFYFFNMDVSTDEAQDAIQIYEAALDRLIEMENKAQVFIGEVDKLLSADEESDMLALILSAYSESVGVDMGIIGVSEASYSLTLVMEAYDSSVYGTNTELSFCREYASYTSCIEGMGEFVTLILDAVK